MAIPTHVAPTLAISTHETINLISCHETLYRPMSLKKIEFIYKVKSFCDTKMHNQDDNASDHGSDAGSEAMFSETEGQDDEEYRPQEVSITLKAEYDSYAEFDQDFKEYCAATFQTYIKRRSDKIQNP